MLKSNVITIIFLSTLSVDAFAFNVGAWNEFQQRCDDIGGAELYLVPRGYTGDVLPNDNLSVKWTGKKWRSYVYLGRNDYKVLKCTRPTCEMTSTLEESVSYERVQTTGLGFAAEFKNGFGIGANVKFEQMWKRVTTTKTTFARGTVFTATIKNGWEAEPFIAADYQWQRRVSKGGYFNMARSGESHDGPGGTYMCGYYSDSKETSFIDGNWELKHASGMLIRRIGSKNLYDKS